MERSLTYCETPLLRFRLRRLFISSMVRTRRTSCCLYLHRHIDQKAIRKRVLIDGCCRLQFRTCCQCQVPSESSGPTDAYLGRECARLSDFAAILVSNPNRAIHSILDLAYSHTT
jgi:hypothetical protein